MRWVQRARCLATAGAMTMLGLACSSDGPSGTTDSIEVTVGPASLSLQQGRMGSVTITLTRGGGFDGIVTLAISGLPAGVTTAINPPTLSATLTATVTVTVAAAVAPGTYTATVTATAPGVGQATTTYQLTVTQASAFAMTVTPNALTIVPGGSSSGTVGIDRTAFTGAVALNLANPVAGISVTFSPAPVAANHSAVAVGVAANVAPGVYPLTIQGVSPGQENRTTTLTITVPPVPVGGNVQYQFCDPAELPVFVAYQDGIGIWQAVLPATSGGVTRYTLNLTQTRGGVMFIYPPAADVMAGIGRMIGRHTSAPRLSGLRAPSLLVDTYVTQVLYGSTVELMQDATESCALTQPRKTLTATIAGVPQGAYGIVSVGGPVEVFEGGVSSNPVTFFGVPSGPIDVIGGRTVPGNAPNKTFVLRNVNVATGGSLPSSVDFNGALSALPATASTTITGADGHLLEVFVDLVTANGIGGMWFDLFPSPAATRPWGGLASMLSSDLHSVVVFASPPGNPGDFRVTVKYVGPVADVTLAMAPTLTLPAASQVSGGAYPRFRFQGAVPPEYGKGASIDLFGVQGEGNIYSILATGAWLAAAGNPLAYDFTMPDVAGLLGFPAASRLTAGANDLSAGAWGFMGAGVFEVRPTLGNEFKAAVKPGTLVVP